MQGMSKLSSLRNALAVMAVLFLCITATFETELLSFSTTWDDSRQLDRLGEGEERPEQKNSTKDYSSHSFWSKNLTASPTQDPRRFNANQTWRSWSNTEIHFCEPCRNARVEHHFQCADRILRLVDSDDVLNNKSAIIEAVQKTIALFTPHCDACRTEHCEVFYVTRLGFDEASPTILKSVVHTNLPSIPRDLVYPPDLKAFKNSFNGDVSAIPYAMYNPSILPLPTVLHKSLPITKSRARPTYLASFRVTKTSNCKLLSYDWWAHNRTDMLGLAVLDESLQGLDVVVDVNANLNFDEAHSFEDFRLFDLGGTIYLSHRKTLLPIEVVVGSASAEGPGFLENKFGDGLSVRVLNSFHHKKAWVKRLPYGKNYNFFRSFNTSIFWVEIWPVPHSVAPVLLKKKFNSVADVREDENIPTPVLYTFENELDRQVRRFSSDRGGACCVRLERDVFQDLLTPSQTREIGSAVPYLLVGISHAKSIRRNAHTKGFGFLSRLYAFVPVEPTFKVVARSGFF